MTLRAAQVEDNQNPIHIKFVQLLNMYLAAEEELVQMINHHEADEDIAIQQQAINVLKQAAWGLYQLSVSITIIGL